MTERLVTIECLECDWRAVEFITTAAESWWSEHKRDTGHYRRREVDKEGGA